MEYRYISVECVEQLSRRPFCSTDELKEGRREVEVEMILRWRLRSVIPVHW